MLSLWMWMWFIAYSFKCLIKCAAERGIRYRRQPSLFKSKDSLSILPLITDPDACTSWKVLQSVTSGIVLNPASSEVKTLHWFLKILACVLLNSNNWCMADGDIFCLVQQRCHEDWRTSLLFTLIISNFKALTYIFTQIWKTCYGRHGSLWQTLRSILGKYDILGIKFFHAVIIVWAISERTPFLR